MDPVTVRSRVDADGTLRVIVPIGAQDANREVQVTVEPVTPEKAASQAEWEAWVDSMAGCWQGGFERPPQGTLEQRDPL
jgi:hypothetical protein